MKEFFEKYKMIGYVVYSLMAGLALVLLWEFNIVKLIVFIPMAALGVYIFYRIFPRPSTEQLTVVSANDDDSLLVTKLAIMRLIKHACTAIKEIKYLKCEVENSRTGVNVTIDIRVLRGKISETSEVVKNAAKHVLAEDLNIRVNKIDIIIQSAAPLNHEWNKTNVQNEVVIGEIKEEVKLISEAPKEKPFQAADIAPVIVTPEYSVSPPVVKPFVSASAEEKPVSAPGIPVYSSVEPVAVKPFVSASAEQKPTSAYSAGSPSVSTFSFSSAEQKPASAPSASDVSASYLNKRFDFAAEMAKKRAEREAFLKSASSSSDSIKH